MPSYTLYYFNGRGRAEICRMLFAAGGVQYNDKRIEFHEWNNFKNNIPCCWMPVLEIDGKTHFPQSMAIARYLAREFGFYGKNNMDMAKIDYITDCFYDILDDYMRMYHEKDGRMMTAMGTEMRQRSTDMTSEMRMRYMDTCRKVLPFLEKTLDMQNGGNQFFMGDQIALCDMMCYAALENPLNDDPSLFNDYPKLRALRTRVASHPKLSPYFSKRINTDF